MKSEPQSPVLLYQTSDGATRLEVRMEDETVWLSQNQMAELFQTSIPNVSMHIRNVFAEGELQPASVLKDFLIAAADGKNDQTKFYNLDVIISVGYRVKSHRGTQFRIWATQRLREYIVKGFAMDDERLKRRGGGNYFEELLSRIRDIRSSEKVFWRPLRSSLWFCLRGWFTGFAQGFLYSVVFSTLRTKVIGTEPARIFRIRSRRRVGRC